MAADSHRTGPAFHTKMRQSARTLPAAWLTYLLGWLIGHVIYPWAGVLKPSGLQERRS